MSYNHKINSVRKFRSIFTYVQQLFILVFSLFNYDSIFTSIIINVQLFNQLLVIGFILFIMAQTALEYNNIEDEYLPKGTLGKPTFRV